MELAVEDEELRNVDALLDTLLNGCDLGDLCRAELPHALDEGEGLESLTHSVKGLDLTRIEDRNSGALVRLGLDQPFGRKNPQRFPDR